jgi:putative NADPH-quinone reductase
LENTLIIIVATAVLHNVAIKGNDNADDFELIQGYENVEDVNDDVEAGRNAVRKALIDTLFR